MPTVGTVGPDRERPVVPTVFASRTTQRAVGRQSLLRLQPCVHTILITVGCLSYE
jgi:hypothetical protein